MVDREYSTLSIQRDTLKHLSQKFTYNDALAKIREESYFTASNCRIRDAKDRFHYQLSLDTKGQYPGLLDTKLNGGLRTSYVTQICGEAGAGKSNFCYWLLAHTITPKIFRGAEKVAILIETESASIERIAAMVPESHREESMERLLVYKAPSSDTLKEIVTELLPKIVRERQNVGLIVIDSIAAPLGHLRGYERKSMFVEIGDSLRALTRDFRCVVVVTNQVRSHIDQDYSILPEDGVERNKPFELIDRRFVPALGLAWRRQIDVSFHIVKFGARRKLIAYNVPYAEYFEVEMLLSDEISFKEID